MSAAKQTPVGRARSRLKKVRKQAIAVNAEIARLRAVNAALVAALRPFLFKGWIETGDGEGDVTVSAKELEAAEAAIAKAEGRS